MNNFTGMGENNNVTAATSSSNPTMIGCGASASPFGILIPGHPLLLDEIRQVDTTRWTLNLGVAAPASFSAFLTHAQGPLKEDCAIGLYMAKCEDYMFEYVGYLAEDHPTTLIETPSSLLSPASQQIVWTVVGFCLLPRSEIESIERDGGNAGGTAMQGVAAAPGGRTAARRQTQMATKYALAERILGDMYNFITSYGRTVNPNEPLILSNVQTPEEYVILPSSFVDQWRERQRKQIEKDPSYWQT